MGKPSRTTRARIDVAKRRARLLELRRAGLTYAEIVENHPDLGYKTTSAAAQDATRALHAVLEEPARDLLALELSRLDAMMQGLWRAARRGDNQSVDRVLRIMDRRARYIGLDFADRNSETTDAEADGSMLDDLDAALRRVVEAMDEGPAGGEEDAPTG